MQARRNIDTDSKEVDKAATNTYSRSNTNKGDVGQYEEARIKSFRTGRLPFSDDGPDTFYEGKDTYFRRKNDGDPSFAENLKGEKFLMSVKEVRLHSRILHVEQCLTPCRLAENMRREQEVAER